MGIATDPRQRIQGFALVAALSEVTTFNQIASSKIGIGGNFGSVINVQNFSWHLEGVVEKLFDPGASVRRKILSDLGYRFSRNLSVRAMTEATAANQRFTLSFNRFF